MCIDAAQSDENCDWDEPFEERDFHERLLRSINIIKDEKWISEDGTAR